MSKRWKRLAWIGPLAILGMLVFAAVGGELVQLLWNWVLPPLFDWPRIGFWQALGLLALCRILFGGLGWRGSGHSSIRRHVVDRVADRMAARWEAMSPEERARFRQRLRERCGLDVSTGEASIGTAKEQ